MIFSFLSITARAETLNPQWIVNVSEGKTTLAQARQIMASVRYWAKHYSLDERLLYKMMYVESRFIPSRLSEAGAMGLLQVIPKYHREKVDETDGRVWPIHSNIKLGAQIVRQYKGWCKDDLQCTMHRYNGLNGRRYEYYRLVMNAPIPSTIEMPASYKPYLPGDVIDLLPRKQRLASAPLTTKPVTPPSKATVNEIIAAKTKTVPKSVFEQIAHEQASAARNWTSKKTAIDNHVMRFVALVKAKSEELERK